jgi:adenylosuccinate synthase
MLFADLTVDGSFGDSGKGCVTNDLLKKFDYSHCLRYNGGCNCGHTLIHEGKKFITHHLPAGILYPNVKSIIGPGCVLNVKQFFKELQELKETFGISNPQIFIAKNTHIITQKHKDEDSKDKKIGTTKSGNGPAYRDKYARVGIRAEDIPELKPYLIDIYKELHIDNPEATVIGEGAQGFGLDIDWGDYPYVTSSSCTVAGFVANGIPYHKIRNVWGVVKCYETYVGAKKFEKDDPIFSTIREIGLEKGATTGRDRAIGWLNINMLKKAADINGFNRLVLNKTDILQQVNQWKVIFNDNVIDLKTEENFKSFIFENLQSPYLKSENIIFSYSPEKI